MDKAVTIAGLKWSSTQLAS